MTIREKVFEQLGWLEEVLTQPLPKDTDIYQRGWVGGYAAALADMRILIGGKNSRAAGGGGE
jgi:hypothetical protein